MEALSLIRVPELPGVIKWGVNWIAFIRGERPQRRASKRGERVTFNGFRYLRTPVTVEDRARILAAFKPLA